MNSPPQVDILLPNKHVHRWDKYRLWSQQTDPAIPPIFRDAMIRQQVFVQEQNVPLEFEHDEDDSRSCHWVAYAPAPQATETSHPLPTHRPIGTLRLVPYPHPPHPQHGGVYIDGKPVNPVGAATEPPGAERPTTLHDGREPYLKLGRLAVLPESRGHGVAAALVREALDWISRRPGFFDAACLPASRGAGQPEDAQEGAGWRGLVCVHAQQDAVRVWERAGFEVDGAMGGWMEEGIPHIGMFRRLEVHPG